MPGLSQPFPSQPVPAPPPPVGPDTAIPSLPTADIRAAIAASDWPQATSLLAAHQQELMRALAAVDLTTAPREPWLALLLTQRALLDELRAARDEVHDALTRLNQDHRGARAWLRELA